MARTTLFLSNRSRAVRLPKDVAFPDGVREATIVRDGPRRIVSPSDTLWDDVFDAPGFELAPREQAQTRAREPL
jgi:antitoxin VapB